MSKSFLKKALLGGAVAAGAAVWAIAPDVYKRQAQEVGGIDLADQGERAYDFAGTASSVLKEVK